MDTVQVRFIKNTDVGRHGYFNTDEVAGFDPDAARALVAKERAVYLDASLATAAPGIPASKAPKAKAPKPEKAAVAPRSKPKAAGAAPKKKGAGK